MDATPVTLGQEFGGYARQIELGIERMRRRRASASSRSAAPPSAPDSTAPGFARSIARVAQETGLDLDEAPNHFEAQGAQDASVECPAR